MALAVELAAAARGRECRQDAQVAVVSVHTDQLVPEVIERSLARLVALADPDQPASAVALAAAARPSVHYHQECTMKRPRQSY